MSAASTTPLPLTSSPELVMSSFLLIWVIVATLALLLVLCRCTIALYILAVIPAALLLLFIIFKHSPITGSNKSDFFQDFVHGGHRGSPRSAPENSIPAFQKAIEEGAQLVEFDIQLSADGVPIIMHDDTTGRTAEANYEVAHTLADQLLNTTLKPVHGISTKIPSLRESIAFCKKNNTKMIFDVKDGSPKMLSQLAEIIKEQNLYSTAIVSSFNPWVPYYLKWADSNILTGFTSRRGALSNVDENSQEPKGSFFTQWLLELADTFIHIGVDTLLLPRFLGVDMLLLNHYDIDVESVRLAKLENIVTVAWTVNDETEMAWMKNVAKVPFLTDEPYRMK